MEGQVNPPTDRAEEPHFRKLLDQQPKDSVEAPHQNRAWELRDDIAMALEQLTEMCELASDGEYGDIG